MPRIPENVGTRQILILLIGLSLIAVGAGGLLGFY
jgi:hypothetical protein